MAWEYVALSGKGEPLAICPACYAAPFEAFLRGQVGRSPWPWWNVFCLGKPRPHSSIICRACKEIVGHENPATGEMEIPALRRRSHQKGGRE